MAESLTRRGHFVTVVTPGDYGQPRPALVVQSDLFEALHSVVVCPLTTTVVPEAGQLRLDVAPTKENGLRQPSQIAIDKMTLVSIGKIGTGIGRADDALMLKVNRALTVFLGIV